MSDKVQIILRICRDNDFSFSIETSKPISLQRQRSELYLYVGLSEFIKEANLGLISQPLVEKIRTRRLIKVVSIGEYMVYVGLSCVAFREIQETANWVVGVVQELLFPDVTKWKSIHTAMSCTTIFNAE